MPLEDDDKKFITDAIAEALKANNGELDKKYASNDAVQKIVEQGLEKLDIGAKLKGALDTELKDIRDKLKDKPGEGGGKDGKGKGGDGEESAEVLKLKERQEELERKLREQEQAAEKAAQQARDTKLDGALRSALAKSGIPADRHDLVIPVLRQMKLSDGEKAVLHFDDAGKPLWAAQRNGYVDKLNIEDGIAEWAKTDVAKVYLPASGKQGSGGGGGETPGGGGGEVTSVDELAGQIVGGLFG